jgi:hypothetical protein
VKRAATAAPSASASASAKAKAARAGPSTATAGVRGKAPLRPATTVKAAGKAPRDTKPAINHGEEEWADLMRKTYGRGEARDAGWYAKGIKTVEVSEN